MKRRIATPLELFAIISLLLPVTGPFHLAHCVEFPTQSVSTTRNIRTKCPAVNMSGQKNNPYRTTYPKGLELLRYFRGFPKPFWLLV